MKNLLVTGAAGGIGSKIATSASKKGYRVGLIDQNSEKLKEVEGIPILKKYRYLGVVLTDSFSVNCHLNNVKSKAAYIRGKMWPFIRKGNVKFRISMFKILVDSLFRYFSCFYGVISKSD